MKRVGFLTTLFVLLSLVLLACVAPSAAPQSDTGAATEAEEEMAEEEMAEEEMAEEEMGEAIDFVSWYQYDQNNEDPASDERVGNEYLRNTIPVFNEAFAGKWKLGQPAQSV